MASRRKKIVLCFTAIVSVLLFAGVWQNRQSRLRRESIEALRNAGYQVRETHKSVIRLPSVARQFRIPYDERIRIYRGLGEGNATLQEHDIPHLERLSAKVEFFSCPLLKIDDKNIPTLARMRHLEKLKLDGSELTNQGAAQLEGLRQLSWVDIYAPNVSDDGFRWLADCDRLSFLDLIDAPISDRCIERLTHLKQLRRIRIPNSGVTSNVIAICGRFPDLYSLDVSGTQVSNDCSLYLPALKSVHSLDLSGTAIGDSICSALAEMPSLETLHIGDTQLSDAGVRYILTRCPQLKELSLGSSKITLDAFDVPNWPNNLERLVLWKMNLSAHDVVSIYNRNSTINSIYCPDCEVDESGKQEIGQILEERRRPITK